MTKVSNSTDKSDRVASVLARATALSDELRGTIGELDRILRQEAKSEEQKGD